MIAKRILSCIKGKQKGDVFVMVAASMAAVMFCGAAVIDLGSLYAHKSELQNAADAAALAGARAMADNEETIDEHPEADNIAKTYVERNLGEGSSASHTFKAKSKNDAIYYRVVLEDDAPTYFYRYFFKTPPRISVEAIASINETMTEKDNGGDPSSSDNGDGGDVFIFRNGFSIDTSVTEGMSKNDKIAMFFNGKVAYTDGTGENNPTYARTISKDIERIYNHEKGLRSEDPNKAYLDCFYTSNAKDMTVSQLEAMDNRFNEGYANKAYYKQYDMNELGEFVRNRMNLPEYTEKPGYNSALDWMENQKLQDDYNNNYVSKFTIRNEKGEYHSSDLSNDIAIVPNPSNGAANIDFKIDSEVNGDVNSPIYVYLDESAQTIHINVEKSNTRPIVFCYMGNTMIDFNLGKNNTFRGVVYAPNLAGDQKFLVHGDPTSTFEGSIIADSINIKDISKFTANSFGIPCLSSNSSGGGNGGSSGNKTSGNESTPTKNIHLSDPPDDINWDD